MLSPDWGIVRPNSKSSTSCFHEAFMLWLHETTNGCTQVFQNAWSTCQVQILAKKTIVKLFIGVLQNITCSTLSTVLNVLSTTKGQQFVRSFARFNIVSRWSQNMKWTKIRIPNCAKCGTRILKWEAQNVEKSLRYQEEPIEDKRHKLESGIMCTSSYTF